MIKNIKDYYNEAKRFIVFPEDQSDWYLTSGVIEEIGEVFGKIKRIIRDSDLDVSAPNTWDEETHKRIRLELGDATWYFTVIIASYCGNDINTGRADIVFSTQRTKMYKRSHCERPNFFQVLLYAHHCVDKFATRNMPFISDFSRIEDCDILEVVCSSIAAIDMAAYLLGYTLEDVFDENIRKLDSREKRNKLHGSGDER